MALESLILRVVMSVFALTILVILVVFFNDTSIAGEKGLLTYVSIILLLCISFVTWYHSYRTADRKEKFLLRLIGMGFFFLTLDEYFKFHERFDKYIHRVFNIRETHITDQLDGVIILVYALVAFGVIHLFRKVFKLDTTILVYMVVAFCLLASTIVLDLIHTSFILDNSYVEESTKVLSEFFFLAAFARTMAISSKRHQGGRRH